MLGVWGLKLLVYGGLKLLGTVVHVIRPDIVRRGTC